MSAWVSLRSGNWTRTSDNADSPWYDAGAQTALSSYPGGAGTGDTVTIGDGVTPTQAVVLDADPANSIATITNGDSTSYISVVSTRSITLTGATGIAYAGTNTSGFVRIGTSGNLTVTGGGAATACLTNTSSGYCVQFSGTTPVLTLNNVGGNAIDAATGTGRVVNGGTGATLTINAAVVSAGTQRVFYGVGTVNVNAAVTLSGTGIVAVFYPTTATINVAADLTGTSYAPVIETAGAATINWTGTRALAAAADLWIRLSSTATLNLGTGVPTPLVLNVSGRMVISRNGATVVSTNCTVNRIIAASQFTCLGQAVTVVEDGGVTFTRRNTLIGR